MLKYQLPPLLWLAFIFFLSSWSMLATLQSPVGFDKVIHAIMWFVLCLLTRRAFFHQQRFRWLRRHDLWGALLATTLYAALDEYYQTFVPARTSDIADVAADFTGALLFVLLFLLKERLRRGGEKPGGV
ncbi:MAG: VanZ family protein [Bacteroidota bacterium]